VHEPESNEAFTDELDDFIVPNNPKTCPEVSPIFDMGANFETSSIGSGMHQSYLS